MALSFRDRAANRASGKYAEIARLQRARRHGEALHVAEGWVRSELAKVVRRRPSDAPAIYAAVTAKLAELAEQIPFVKPGSEGESDVAS